MPGTLHADTTSPTKQRIATLLAVAAFGLFSVLLGQDTNWDLLNYHLYNPWALLNGRLHTDLAAAGFQSYFNPLIDLPYYWMTMHLPAPAVAFVMGCVHGIALPIVVAIARKVRPDAPASEAWWLGIAGCLGAAFFAEIGNTMGDATTAPLVLGAVVLCMGSGGTRRLVIAGLLVGAATGLKLTNASYAVALAVALLVVRTPIRAVGALVAGGIAGLALTGGFWFWRMAGEFGNPLFPQFNSVFGSPLAAAIGQGDPRWGPKGVFEALAYPFIFTINPDRVGEMPIRQLLWPAVYVLFIAWAVKAVVRRGTPVGLEKNSRFLLAFVAAAYLVWLVVFAIGRYAVAMEVLLPLVVWVLVQSLVGTSAHPTPGAHNATGRKIAKVIIIVAVIVSVAPLRTWGHASFADKGYSVTPPPIDQPGRATIIMLAQPVAWMAVFFPPELAYVSFFNFPESPGYYQRAEAIMAGRGGDLWAIVPAASDTAANTLARYNEWARRRGISADGLACKSVKRLSRLSTRFRDATLRPGDLCEFELPAARRRDVQAEDRVHAQRWATLLRERKLSLEPANCRRHEASMGETAYPYQFCRVTR